MDLYFDCGNGISGDMSVAALLDLGADREKLENVLKSINLDNEFKYVISQKSVNSISATDFDVILPAEASHNEHHPHHDEHHEHHHGHQHEHIHRNLDDVNAIIDRSNASEGAKTLAKKIFQIVAEAEAKVHGKVIKDVHLHEVGAIDTIADILSFAVLYDELKPENVYFSPLTEGRGFVECHHGRLSVPVPAMCEIVSKYQLPVKFIDNDGEMVTPTGAAIVAALYTGEKLPEVFVINKIGYGAGKRPYANPMLRVMSIQKKGE